MKKGKLIVLDGGDGSGKATQTALLLARLKKEKTPVRTLDFPHYENNFFGAFIGTCLRGDHGDFVTLDPYIASVLYGADRFESKKKIEDWLAKGYTVLLDRYVSANQMHQGGKISDPKELKKFLTWLDEMEHSIFKIPRPHAIIYLDMPIAAARELLVGAQDKKEYLKGKKDSTEESIEYLENSRKRALSIVKKMNNWHKISCVERRKLRTREDIHEELYGVVQDILKNRS